MQLAGLVACLVAGILLATAVAGSVQAAGTTTIETTAETTAEPTTVVTTETVEQTTTRQIILPSPTTTSSSSSSSETPAWVWVLLAILAVGLVIVIVLLARRGGKDSGVSAAERRHRLDGAVAGWTAQGWALESQTADSAVLQRAAERMIVERRRGGPPVYAAVLGRPARLVPIFLSRRAASVRGGGRYDRGSPTPQAVVLETASSSGCRARSCGACAGRIRRLRRLSRGGFDGASDRVRVVPLGGGGGNAALLDRAAAGLRHQRQALPGRLLPARPAGQRRGLQGHRRATRAAWRPRPTPRSSSAPRGPGRATPTPSGTTGGPGATGRRRPSTSSSPTIDRHYRTIARARRAAIIGISAGGYGATLIAIHHPGTYQVIESWSGYFVHHRPRRQAAGPRLGGGERRRQRARQRAPAQGRVRALRQDVLRLLHRRQGPVHRFRRRQQAALGPRAHGRRRSPTSSSSTTAPTTSTFWRAPGRVARAARRPPRPAVMRNLAGDLRRFLTGVT